MLGILINTLLCLTCPAQEMTWIDASGSVRRTRDRTTIPPLAWPTVRMRVKGAKAVTGDRFTTHEGFVVVLEGVQAPEIGSGKDAATFGGEAARRRLQELIGDEDILLEFEGFRPLQDGACLAHATLPDGRALRMLLAAEGHLRPALLANGHQDRAALLATMKGARDAGRGVWARTPSRPPTREVPFFRGFSLGLYAFDEDFDYDPILARIQAMGATDVLLISPRFLEDWRAVRIVPLPHRTIPWVGLERTVRQCRARGLRVTLMPIILLKPGNDEHWRGNIEPRELLSWFHDYARLLGTWADVAEREGAHTLVVGSEFCSLEKEAASWRSLIQGLRARFDGCLTYSANWDQLDVVTFWDDLDAVGMTGYHRLTLKSDPTVDELVDAWKPIRERIEVLMKRTGRPAFFTEIGYASQDGINTDPWNYRMSKVADPLEQADCYRAYFQTWSSAPAGFRGALFYDFWRNGNAEDALGYSVEDKPAAAIIRRAFSR